MKTCALVNIESGGWERHATEIKRLARHSQTELVVLQEHGDLSEVFCHDSADEEHRVIIVGGDGTVSRVINQATADLSGLEFAVVPVGTGNDLARSLGLHGVPLDITWQWAVSRPATEIDLIKATGQTTHFVVNAATAGFGGMVSTDVDDRDKHRWGAIAYWITAFSHLVYLEEFEIDLRMDSGTVHLTTYGLAISNGRYVGGGFPVAPNALINDGLLHVTTVPVLPPLELLAAGVDFTLGRGRSTQESVRSWHTSQLHVHAQPVLPYSLDGEPARGIDATFEIVPGGLSVVCGPHAAAVRPPT